MRRLSLFIATTVFVDAMLFGALTPLVPAYAEEYGLSKMQAGLLLGAFGAGAIVGGVGGGLVAMRIGQKRTVLGGLVTLAIACVLFAAADSAALLAASRVLQGAASSATFAGALAWLTMAAAPDRRGQTIGTAFGAAVAGAVIGPLFGSIADLVGIRVSFVTVAVVALALVAWGLTCAPVSREPQAERAVRRAFRDRRFLGGLWLNLLPSFLYSTLILLVPLTLADAGYTVLAIGVVFFVAGLVEIVIHPLLGRYSDRVGRLAPIRIALIASIVASIMLAVVSTPAVLVVVFAFAVLAYSAAYTPGMALASDRAEIAGLSQGLTFGLIDTAWATGNLAGPVIGGALATATGDAAAYVVAALLCVATLVAAGRSSGRVLVEQP